MANTNIPDAEERIRNRDKDVPWYNPELGTRLAVGSSARELLEKYSKIPPTKVEDHVSKIVRPRKP